MSLNSCLYICVRIYSMLRSSDLPGTDFGYSPHPTLDDCYWEWMDGLFRRLSHIKDDPLAYLGLILTKGLFF